MNVALVRKGSTEGPWALPEGWCWSLLSDVAFVNPATSFDHLAASDSVTFVPMAAVAEETGTIDLSIERPMKEVAKGYVRFAEGDVIFAKITPCMENGKIAPVPTLRQGVAAGSTEFHVLRPAAIEQRYLWYWLVGRAFRGRAKRKMSGSAGQLRVPVTYLRESEVPVPPLAEQRRIVARIDALFEEIAEGERALDVARKGLETYRRALLKAAVTGELTAEWRSHYDDAASAADLLARLRSRYPEERPTIARWSAPASLPTIPYSWTWCAVAEAGEVQLGRQRAPQHHAGDHMRPYLRVANVLEDHFDLTDVKAMNFTPTEFETFELRTGDILLNEGQAPDLLGRSAIYNGEIPGCCFQKTLLRFRAKEGVNPAYAQLVFRHYMHSGRFKRESRITTNIGHLTQVRFVVMEFPLPPSLEQDAIVALFGELDAALGELDPIATDAVRLRQSVLKAAFEGRLVPQDESDEPAAMMLARIEASQAEAPRRRRGRPIAVTP
jgi:type I restriction enzyme S subunit